ncbi:hypothetical protein ILUMI_26104 [Ignelater luminosus]|uniref:PiggyBac transposable element-derived protein domain-containing protein n=1 Tax=Ignelater luminosus TaxID=2038154 RepID=A0A8K0C8M3_IGNLU|nr:hypothetical protein ILUMI_26104 [Ignelater luminosus]
MVAHSMEMRSPTNGRIEVRQVIHTNPEPEEKNVSDDQLKIDDSSDFDTINGRYEKCTDALLWNGAVKVRSVRDDGTSYMKWKNKRVVQVLPTISFSDSTLEVQRQEKGGNTSTTKCPEIVVEYRWNMNCIDKSDQLGAFYTIDRKNKMWYPSVGMVLSRFMCRQLIHSSQTVFTS